MKTKWRSTCRFTLEPKFVALPVLNLCYRQGRQMPVGSPPSQDASLDLHRREASSQNIHLFHRLILHLDGSEDLKSEVVGVATLGHSLAVSRSMLPRCPPATQTYLNSAASHVLHSKELG